MNIKKLIEQATTIEEFGWGASYAHFDKKKFAELVAAQEREECAKVCELQDGAGLSHEYWWECAAAIRARSKDEQL